MSITLRKVLTQNIKPLIRSAFAEDLDFLRGYNGNEAKGLDLATMDYLNAILPNDLFFRIENIKGAYIGFFTFTMPDATGLHSDGSLNIGVPATMTFYIRKKPFRTDTYIQAFWALVDETFCNGLYTSVGSTNLTGLPGSLNSDFSIKNNNEYTAKNFVILKS